MNDILQLLSKAAGSLNLIRGHLGRKGDNADFEGVVQSLEGNMKRLQLVIDKLKKLKDENV